MNLAAFREGLLKPSVKLRYKFLYDSVNKTDLISKTGLATIRRDINLSAGLALVTLNNAGGWWNFLKDSNVALGDDAEIQVYVQGDEANAYTLFKGVAMNADYEGPTVTLSIKDHNGSFLDQKVGSNKTPAGSYAAAADADVHVWRLLTSVPWGGGLDSLAGPGNTAIKYASFAAWRDNHIRPNDYNLSGNPKGQTVAQLLMKICQMTHSYIWVNNNGLVEFAPPFEPGFDYSELNTGSIKKPGGGRDLTFRPDLKINNVTVRYGYVRGTKAGAGEWTGSVDDTDATSIARFGSFPKTVEGRIFTHFTEASATSDRDATLANYAYPLRFFNLTAGFPAIMEDLGRQITVSDTQKLINSVAAFSEGIIYDLNTWEIKIKARWPW